MSLLTTYAFVQYIAIAIAFVVIAALAVLDLLYREIKPEWLYAILLVCGLVTDAGLVEKLLCLIGIPLALILSAAVIGKRKGLEPTDVVGGADIKTMACIGFVFGIRVLAASSVLSIVFAIPFIMEQSLHRDEPGNRAVPFCTTMALGVLCTYSIAFSISFMR